MVADRSALAGLAKRDPALVQATGDGAYRYAACSHEAGVSALVMVVGRGPFDLGPPTVRGGWSATTFAQKFAQLASQRGWKVQAAWRRVNSPVAPAGAKLAAPALSAKVIAPYQLAGVGAAVIAAPAKPLRQPEPDSRPAVATATAASDEQQACWRAAGQGWSYLGYAGRDACVAQVFTADCQTVYGRWGDRPLRRYDGKLQLKTTGLFSSWKTVAASQCPAAPADASR